jgi:exodeoxyribonuclease V alpha subunit
MSDGGETAFEKCEDDPLEYGAVVVDESSMVDLLLMHALCRALPSGCRLLLIGDENQLPSIGAGNVLADVIRSGAVPVIALTEIFRQADGSGIVSAAHSVNRGEEPDFSAKSGDIFFMKRRTAQSVAETVAELVTKRLPDNMGIPSAQIQTLSPTRRGEAGTAKLNERLQEALNPKTEGAAELNRGSFALRSGDRIMQTRNNYDIEWTDGRGGGAGVFNGDLGTVASINFASDTVTAVFEDRIVEYAFSQLDDIELSYAMTVHKSQGSEYRAVVLALPPGIPRLAVRSLLYTAVTRARELLVIVGDEGTLSDMIRNNKRRRRFSGLRARLSDADA